MTEMSPICEALLESPGASYPDFAEKCARLTDAQAEQLAKIQNKVRKIVALGDIEEAERVAKIAERILMEGAPTATN